MSMVRKETRGVRVGNVVIGGSHDIVIQSMTTTTPDEIPATLDQIQSLQRAGCALVRIAVPSERSAAALASLRRAMHERDLSVPLVADVHFSPRAALEAAGHVEKVRINPGNFASSAEEAARHLAPLLERLRTRGAALRVGVNHGSLAPYIADEYGHGPEGMVTSAMEYLHICRDFEFEEIVVSLKASNPALMVEANRLLVRRMNDDGFACPIHLGVTEAGEGREGSLRSAVGIGALLLEGIGDTIRVSLTGDPTREIGVCEHILQAVERATAQPIRCPSTLTMTRPRAPIEEHWNKLPVGGSCPPRVELGIPISACSLSHPETKTLVSAACRAALDEEAPAESFLLLPEEPLEGQCFDNLAAVVRALREQLAAAGSDVPFWLAIGPHESWWREIWADTPVERKHSGPPLEKLLGVADGFQLEVPADLALAAAGGKALHSGSPIRVALGLLFARMAEMGNIDPGATGGGRTPRIRWHLPLPDLGPESREIPQEDETAHRRLADLARHLRFLTQEMGLGTPSFSWKGRPAVAMGHRLATALSVGDADGPRPLLLPWLPDDPWEATVTVGSLLLDGLADGIVVGAEAGGGIQPASRPAVRPDAPVDFRRPLHAAYEILQASRRRLLRAEFISCPGCGRLSFDLEGSVRRLKAKLGHLRGVKIAIMGCAVNGPGEMADADFGYVGSVGNKVDLYVGHRRVQRALVPEEADKALIVLLREQKRWREPA